MKYLLALAVHAPHIKIVILVRVNIASLTSVLWISIVRGALCVCGCVSERQAEEQWLNRSGQAVNSTVRVVSGAVANGLAGIRCTLISLLWWQVTNGGEAASLWH